MRKFWRTALIVPGVLLIAAVSGFIIWAESAADPMPEALTALQSDSQVTLLEGEWLVFSPAGPQPDTGLVFYPGGRVDYRAYAPAARQIAAQGYLVVIVEMPLNLAVLNPDAAGDVITAHPEIHYWAVGGHSLGGAMAANFAKNNPDVVDGLALWAAYPASNNDLSYSNLDVVSIYGSLDGLASGEKIDESRALLPGETTWVAIEGGNHAQFGWYGEQSGDHPATISRQEQQDQVVMATIDLLERIEFAHLH